MWTQIQLGYLLSVWVGRSKVLVATLQNILTYEVATVSALDLKYEQTLLNIK